jgi:hypothetical protein
MKFWVGVTDNQWFKYLSETRIEDIISKKLKINYEKYPVEKAKGTATKYNKLF